MAKGSPLKKGKRKPIGAEKKTSKVKKAPGRRRGKPTIPIQGAVNNPQVGRDERLVAFVQRAVELKRKDYFHHQIAQIIADEFKLSVVPSIPTISYWLAKDYEIRAEDIEEMKKQMRQEEFKRLEKLIAKWMPIALADDLQIQRWHFEEGVLQPFMDENATKEQLEATKVITKLIDQEAKLMGLNMEKVLTSDKDGPQDLMELQLWIINRVNGTAPNGKAIDVMSEKLELRSGIPEIDNPQNLDSV